MNDAIELSDDSAAENHSYMESTSTRNYGTTTYDEEEDLVVSASTGTRISSWNNGSGGTIQYAELDFSMDPTYGRNGLDDVDTDESPDNSISSQGDQSISWNEEIEEEDMDYPIQTHRYMDTTNNSTTTNNNEQQPLYRIYKAIEAWHNYILYLCNLLKGDSRSQRMEIPSYNGHQSSQFNLGGLAQLIKSLSFNRKEWGQWIFEGRDDTDQMKYFNEIIRIGSGHAENMMSPVKTTIIDQNLVQIIYQGINQKIPLSTNEHHLPIQEIMPTLLAMSLLLLEVKGLSQITDPLVGLTTDALGVVDDRMEGSYKSLQFNRIHALGQYLPEFSKTLAKHIGPHRQSTAHVLLMTYINEATIRVAYILTATDSKLFSYSDLGSVEYTEKFENLLRYIFNNHTKYNNSLTNEEFKQLLPLAIRYISIPTNSMFYNQNSQLGEDIIQRTILHLQDDISKSRTVYEIAKAKEVLILLRNLACNGHEQLRAILDRYCTVEVPNFIIQRYGSCEDRETYGASVYDRILISTLLGYGYLYVPKLELEETADHKYSTWQRSPVADAVKVIGNFCKSQIQLDDFDLSGKVGSLCKFWFQIIEKSIFNAFSKYDHIESLVQCLPLWCDYFEPEESAMLHHAIQIHLMSFPELSNCFRLGIMVLQLSLQQSSVLSDIL